MAERIASGEIHVEVNDKGALARLRAIDEQFNRTMREIDRQQATVDIDGNLAGLNDAVANAKRQVRKLEGEKATVEVDADTKELDAALKEARRAVKKLDGQKATAELEWKSDSSELALAEKRIKAIEAREAAREKALERQATKARKRAREEQAWVNRQARVFKSLNDQRMREEEAQAKSNIAWVNRQARVSKSLADQRSRELSAAEQQAYAVEAANEAASRAGVAWVNKQARVQKSLNDQRLREMSTAEREAHAIEVQRSRELAAIPKMRREYAELASTIEKLQEARRKVKRDDRARLVVDLKIEEAVAKMRPLKETLERIGSPVDLEVQLAPGADFGARMRSAVGDGFRHRGVRQAATNAGVLAGLAFTSGMGSAMKRNFAPKALLGGLAEGGTRLLRVLGGLSEMTVRLGPFTATIRQAFVGLSVLAPIILDIVGALGALIGVVGSATLGLGALSAGFLGGAIPAALGFGFVIKDVAQEFDAAKKATKAYNDAVSKHGKGSDQAAKKMKELKNVMGGVSDTTAKQFVEAQKLGKAWDKATKPGRASVWKGLGDGLETASKLMPQFAKRTNEGLDIAQRGISKWMKGIRSEGGRSVLDNLMGNFNKSLGPLLAGLGNIGAYIGKVASLASNRIPGLANTFERWSAAVLGTADDMGALDSRVGKVIQSAKDVGNFFLAAGRLMKAFFGGGVDAGQSFTRTMTDAMNRWTRFLGTTEGQNSLASFFEESVAGAQALYGALEPIVSTFVRWAGMISPFVRGFFEGAGAIGSFVSAMLRLTGLTSPLAALATTLGTLWAIGKIRGATMAVTGFTTALLGMNRAAAAGSIAGAARGAGVAGSVAAGAAAGRVAAANAGRTAAAADKVQQATQKAAASSGRMSGALRGLASGAGGAVTALTGLNPVVGGLVLAGGAAAFGIYKLMTRTHDYETAAKNAAKAASNWRTAIELMPEAHTQAAGAVLAERGAALQLRDAQKEVNRLRKEGKTGTDAYQYAILNLRNAQHNAYSTQQATIKAAREEASVVREATKAAKTRADEAKRSVEQFSGEGGSQKWAVRELNELMQKGLTIEQARNKLAREHDGTMEDQVQTAANLIAQQETSNARLRRQQELGVLAVLNQKRAAQGLVPVAQNAARAFAQVASQSRKISTKIALKFEDPGQAARVAASAAKTLKSGLPQKMVLKIVAESKSAEDAIRRLQARRLTAKRLEIIENGGSEALAMVSRIAGRKLNAKESRVIEKGGQAALQMLGQIIGRNLPPKTQTIAEQGGNGVLGILRGIAGVSLPPKTQTITIRKVLETVNRGIIGKRGRASGRRPGQAEQALVGEGRGDEVVVDTRTGEGFVTDGPQFTRLKASDAVIPTEPRYRQRGRAILEVAADALGIQKFAAGKFSAGSAYKGATGGEYYKPSRSLGEAPSREKSPKNIRRGSSGFRKRKSRAYKSGRGYIRYIAGLKTAQDDWEREVSIRESQVEEPSDLLVEQGRIVVNNPETGKPEDVGPRMVPNEAGIAKYKDGLRRVQEAFMQVLTIIKTLIAAIPNALSAINVEEAYRTANIKNLNADISLEKNIIAARKKGGVKGKDAAIIKRHEEKLRQAEREKEHEKGQLETLKEDRTGLNEDYREAGFDFRETTILSDKNQAEFDAVSGRAVSEATAANVSTAGSGAGGGGAGGGAGAASDQLTYGAQAALADTERANVLRQFGSNIMGAMTPTGGAPGVGGGAFTNPASRSGSFGGGTTSGSRTAVSSGAAAGAALSPAGRAGASSGPTTAPAAPTKNVNIVNNFAAPPPDEHTYVKGMEFQAGAAF